MNIETTHITRILAAISLVTLAGCGGDSATKSNFENVDASEPVSDWQMVWSDEFEGSAIDTNKWNYELNCDGGGNNEKQCYTDSEQNAFIADGVLNIVALPAEEGAEKPYTSARLNTRYNADFTYGRFEVRAKLPSGQGSWPAFWMLPTDEVYGTWPRSGEIDVLESVNLKTPDEDGGIESSIHGTLHYGRAWPDNSYTGKEYKFPEDTNPADDFHTYAVEWQEGEIRWYVDGYLYATQRQSEVRTNASGEAVGLKHRGWFAEYFEQGSGELTTHWDSAPFDKDFHLLLNLAVGGDWPENVNDLGVDASAFENGQTFAIDYVRVYQCASNPETGKGCETIRPGYNSLDDALLEGDAPIPSPPSTGIATPLTIFGESFNPNWPAWDCCGGSTPAIVADETQGDVVEFVVGAEPTVMGFISREIFITDEAGKASPFDASPMLDEGYVRFKMKVTNAPGTADAAWLVKLESNEGSSAVEMPITDSVEGVSPVVGQWQTYTFLLKDLDAADLDISAIDVIMVFPTWGAGEGAVYLIDDVEITQDNLGVSPELTIFTDEQNLAWPMWDCCGGSTPVEAMDDEEHGLTAEFSIGAEPTVMGFNSRTSSGGAGESFDASSILDEGVIQFDLKVTSTPSDPATPWLFKVESNGGDSAVELELTASVEGVAPVTGEWQTYTFKLSDLAAAGLDVSTIDVLMIFPAWGAGEGSVYRVDNVKIYNPNAAPAATGELTVFKDAAADQWSIWDCCGGSTPTTETDDDAHGAVAQFSIGSTATVMGFIADEDVSFDASAILENGVVQFDMKVVSAPSDIDAQWLFKIESIGTSSAVELALSSSVEGQAPVTGEWQTYTFPLQQLFDAGLDISALNVIMVFPSWDMGDGALYRIDNVIIANP
ncbi:family 16 glycosylhydrolase [Pseudoalteromonas sp. NZS71]|uniref:glycoside hydrolase family 16 protein n=1 Tax=unclassified Pseudoalteromonas TaxID=194690 RepID=UPI0015FF3AC6|nr:MULTISPECIES: glycoside hydrolase family 16 protein [unclassified Pseudoalteromonas]MBB1442112.1 family 16 glycosylhydrolase [Pseudoalteromonas sp. SG43-3]MBH0059696.1 family 16 glycosylhydrolase [Pseudoalteromonas sp. NZS71]